ncbi:anaerobic ribonucleoside-triphosphate reductase-activating protein [Planctomycetales bacterium]|nr:anaerobic ribonucleoside-triphosphate reductase-activating protein [Planctomycetales bacterium]GHT34879.1 anaerobic ribonucleoside-triphosphate reductase-activating protein [Planctomycetales bacterium]
MTTLRVHRLLYPTSAEGPGSRCALWVQGCPLHCKGCAVPQTWNPDGGTICEVSSLTEEIAAQKELDGITFLGGEPFEQAEALAELAENLRQHGFSVITFTGYEKSFIDSANRQDWNRLIAATDLLKTGHFIEDAGSAERPWVGSSNQEFHFLTEQALQWKEHIGEYYNKVEVRIAKDGTFSLNGLAAPPQWKEIVKRLQTR